MSGVPVIEARDDTDDWQKAREAERRNEIRFDLTKKYDVQCQLITLDEAVTGPFEEIVGEFDYRTYQSLAVEFGQAYGSRDTVRLFIRPRRGVWRGAASGVGVTLFVQSSDTGWTKQVLAQVSDELDHGRPSWAWLYTYWGGMIYVWAVMAALALAANSLSVKLTSFSQLTIIWLAVATASAAGAFMISTAWPLMTILPPVEVHPDGATPRGARSVAFLIGVVVVPVMISLILTHF